MNIKTYLQTKICHQKETVSVLKVGTTLPNRYLLSIIGNSSDTTKLRKNIK